MGAGMSSVGSKLQMAGECVEIGDLYISLCTLPLEYIAVCSYCYEESNICVGFCIEISWWLLLLLLLL